MIFVLCTTMTAPSEERRCVQQLLRPLDQLDLAQLVVSFLHMLHANQVLLQCCPPKT